MQTSELFSTFSYPFFCSPNFSEVKMYNLFCFTFGGTYRSVIHLFRECQKAKISWISLKIKITILQKYRFQFFNQSLDWKSSTYGRQINRQKNIIFSVHRKTKIPKYQKSAINIDSSWYSNSAFSVTTSLIFSNKASIENLSHVKKDSIEKSFNSVLASKCWQSKLSKKFQQKRSFSVFKIIFLRDCRLGFFNQGLNRGV